MNSYRASSCFYVLFYFSSFEWPSNARKSQSLYSMVANTNASTMRPDIKILARLKSIWPWPKCVIQREIWWSTLKAFSYLSYAHDKYGHQTRNQYKIGANVRGLLSQASIKLIGKLTSNSKTAITINTLWKGIGSKPKKSLQNGASNRFTVDIPKHRIKGFCPKILKISYL